MITSRQESSPYIKQKKRETTLYRLTLASETPTSTVKASLSRLAPLNFKFLYFCAFLLLSFAFCSQITQAQSPQVLATVSQVRNLLASRCILLSNEMVLDKGLIKGIKEGDSSASLGQGTWSDIQKYLLNAQASSPSKVGHVGELAIARMVEAVGDPYTALLNKQDMASDKVMAETGSFTGIGVELAWKGHVVVVSPIAGSPAAAAGLRSGDIISSVDACSLEGMSFYRAGDKLLGPQGSQVTLGIVRGGKSLQLNVTRRKLSLPGLVSSFLAPGVGYIKIGYFSPRTGGEVASALQKLKNGGCRSLVLDLRGNPGGDFQQGVSTASLFCSGNLIIKETRAGKVKLTNKLAPSFTGKIAVLTDSGTASSSEIVAQSLQGLSNVKIVGSQTFGKGLIQTLFPLPGGWGVRISTGRYWGRNGRCLHGRGLSPDIAVSSGQAKEKALKYLLGGK